MIPKYFSEKIIFVYPFIHDIHLIDDYVTQISYTWTWLFAIVVIYNGICAKTSRYLISSILPSPTSNCGYTICMFGECGCGRGDEEIGSEEWGGRRKEEGEGGSKCQVPLGSDDGGYIYQSKQPRGAEYFTCRCALLHYHIHQSHIVPFQPLTIQN